MLGRFQANRSTKAKVVSSSSSKTSTFKYNGINRLTTRSYTPERKVPVTIAYGDGIGPEITAATVKILEQAGAQVSFEPIEIGEKLYLGGHKSGIAPSAWDSIRKSRVFLKAPITTHWRRLQIPQCYYPKDFGLVRQCSPLQIFTSFCGNQTPCVRHGYCP
jgi:hypothetical protein